MSSRERKSVIPVCCVTVSVKHTKERKLDNCKICVKMENWMIRLPFSVDESFASKMQFVQSSQAARTRETEEREVESTMSAKGCLL